MSRLLYKQGWKISCDDKSLIRIENRKGGVINFDIVVSTEKGPIDACKFVCSAEVAMVSTKVGMKANVNTINCQLAYMNKNYIQKTAWELG
jgi:hypothetical protein